MNHGTWLAAGFTAVGSAVASVIMFYGKPLGDLPFAVGFMSPWFSAVAGIVCGIVIGMISEYYTSYDYKPTKKLAEACKNSAAITITEGLSVGMKSTLLTVLTLGIALLVANFFSGTFGVAMAAVGMLSFVSITVSVDTYGPISDNAGGIAEMTVMKAIEAGCDIVDTALSPLSGGTSQPCTESLQYALSGTEYDPGLKLDYLKKACEKLTVVKDAFLKEGKLNPKALTVNPNILKYQVPGGMLSNLMSQLQGQGAMDKYEEVLREIPRVRKDLGYPPLVTPLSQMVGTQAVMNVLFGERYKACPKEIIEYLKGNYGKAPAEVNEDVRKKIIGDAEVITYRPADKIAPEFDAMKEKYGNICKCDEDVLSCALFENVAVKFLEAKYAPKEEDEVVEFNVVIG